jgi:2-iminobutanoate/2-iminopropanoate deaminase
MTNDKNLHSDILKQLSVLHCQQHFDFRYLIKSNTLSAMPKEVIYSPHAPEPIGPYSQAIQVGAMLFVSGQIAIQKSTGKMITDNITDETNQVMANLGDVLTAAGMDFSHVVKCTIFLKDMNQFPQVNEAYGKKFSSGPPARETVQVSRLPKDVNVEISCIAMK